MHSLEQFQKVSPKKFKTTVGNEMYDKYEIFRRGLNVGQSVTQMTAENAALQEFNNSGETQALILPRDGEGRTQTRAEYVQGMVGKMTGHTPYGSDLNYYLGEFNRASQIYQGDLKASNEYLKVSAEQDAVVVNGQTIQGGRKLDTVVPDYRFQDVMDYMQDTKLTFGVALVMAGTDRDTKKEHPDKWEDIPNLKMYTVQGQDGVFFKAPSMRNIYNMDNAEIEQVAGMMRESGRRATQQMEAKALAQFKQRKRMEQSARHDSAVNFNQR